MSIEIGTVYRARKAYGELALFAIVTGLSHEGRLVHFTTLCTNGTNGTSWTLNCPMGIEDFLAMYAEDKAHRI
jgi:hypothetical protein